MSNAKEINRLKARVDESVKHRGQNEEKRKEWKQACSEFHARYDALAFPGGLAGAYERILSGDAEAMEAAICFLECRPYFFRSGYMFKDILKKSRKAPLRKAQRVRLDLITKKYDEYRENRKSTHE